MEGIFAALHEDHLDDPEDVLFFFFVEGGALNYGEELMGDVGIFKGEVYAVDLGY